MRREFTQKVKVQAFELAGGKCQTCGLKIRGGAEYDHVVPCALGGEASIENCAVLCSACHRRKTSGEDVPRISKAKRIHAAFLDVTTPEPLPADHPLWDLPNAHITMHLSGRAQDKMFIRSVERFLVNLERYRQGEPLEPMMDLTLGY